MFPRLTKGGESEHGWPYLETYNQKQQSDSLTCYLSLANTFMHMIKEINALLPKTLMIIIILESEWTRALWPKTCKQEFSQIWGLHQKTDNYNVLCFRLLQAKVMTKFCEKYKKLHFEPFLKLLGQTRIFLRYSFLSLFSISRFLLLCKISEKTSLTSRDTRKEFQKASVPKTHNPELSCKI